jgi:hypothetical protein
MSQSDLYKYQSNIDYLGDFPGADVEKNRVLTTLEESTAKLDIESRVGRTLGTVGVNDTGDSQIDPATEGTLSTVADLADALASNGGDTLRTDATLDAETVAIEGDDDDGNTVEANIETLSQAVTDPDGLVTYLARALQQYGDDQLRVDIENEGVDMASETTLSSADTYLGNLDGALQSQASDEMRVDLRTDDVGLATESTLSSVDSGVENLDDATQTQANDQLRVDIETNNADVATESSLTSEQAREIATWTAGTLGVEQQSPVAVEDSGGTTVDPAVSTDYLDHQTSAHDLATADLTIGPGAVERGTAVTIAATSTDNNTFSVSVEWVDGSGNTYQSESATDIGLDSVTEDYARLVRKAPQVQITVTDTSGAAQNLVNVHADTER